MNLFILFLFKFYVPELQAASCCKAGGSGVSLMRGLHQYETSLTHAYSRVAMEQFETERPIIWEGNRRQITQTSGLHFAYALHPLWQVGISTALTQRKYRTQGGSEFSDTRWGDTTFQMAYEILTETPSFVWTPQVFLSLNYLYPTGRGLYESQGSVLEDVSGNGQSRFLLGAHFFKAFNFWDTGFEVRYGQHVKRKRTDYDLLARRDLQLDTHLQRFLGGENWSLGLRLSAFFNQGISRSDRPQSPSERYYEVSPYLSYAFSNIPWMVGLSYSDQTLLGPVQNATLSRATQLTLTHYSLF